MQKELTYEEIQIGDTADFSKTISEFDIYQFAGITGDFNPMHINEEFARYDHFQGSNCPWSFNWKLYFDCSWNETSWTELDLLISKF